MVSQLHEKPIEECVYIYIYVVFDLLNEDGKTFNVFPQETRWGNHHVHDKENKNNVRRNLNKNWDGLTSHSLLSGTSRSIYKHFLGLIQHHTLHLPTRNLENNTPKGLKIVSKVRPNLHFVFLKQDTQLLALHILFMQPPPKKKKKHTHTPYKNHQDIQPNFLSLPNTPQKKRKGPPGVPSKLLPPPSSSPGVAG